MICSNCGNQMEDGAAFCTECGAPSMPQDRSKMQPSPAETPDSLLNSAELTAQEAVTQSVNKGKKRFLFLAAAAAVVLIVVCLLVIGAIRKRNYETAISLYAAGKYGEAAEAFAALGNYQDSDERALLSAQWADYTNACDLIETFRYEDTLAAKQIFLSLGGFRDAEEKAVYCQNNLDLEAANALMDAREYARAKAAFDALGAFADAKSRARFCSDTLDYNAAIALIDQGDYAAAAEKLAAPSESGIEDSVERLIYCENKVAYQTAEQALNDGKHYEAYEGFLSLGAFEDAPARAIACILETPENGEVYRNADYNYKQADLKVINSYDEDTYIKLYSSSGDLVCSFYIRAGESATVYIPAGTYRMNRAFGTIWFGAEDMFGDEGTYYRQKIGDSYEFTLLNNYAYTISRGSTGTSVQDTKTDRAGF